MFQSLKIAVKNQKKLLVIFLITIFFPSVLLSIFGVIALRNENYRVEKQIENDQIRLIENFKNSIHSRLNEINNRIESLATHPSIQNKDYSSIKNLLEKQFENEPLIDHIFLLYENEGPFFPVFQAGFGIQNNSPELSYDNFQLNTIRLAEDFEFQQKKYLDAILSFNKLFDYSKDKLVKASALNCMARNYTKLGNHSQALNIHLKIINEYPEVYSTNGLPIILQAKLLASECYQKLGEPETAINTALEFYNELVNNKWNLSEDRFYTYIELTAEILNILFTEEKELNSKYKEKYQQLEKAYQLKTEEWQKIRIISSDIIPELREITQNNQPSPIQILKTIGGTDYMILVVVFAEGNNRINTGLLGITLDQNFLEKKFLKNEIEKMEPLENTALCITNLSGRLIMGNKTKDQNLIKTIGFPDDNFPPWQIEISYTGSEGPGNIKIFSSFFFWTIITLILILVFGTTMIVKIVSREMELLKMKSDFISSVSHEFKTPLASMKVLTERLEEGKVTQPVKMKQYFSLLSFDIERLIRLVNNILNFSKIEAGKKVYKMEETNISYWLKQVITNYEKNNFENDINFHVQLAKNIQNLSIDKESLSQALFNLLDNAVKFSPGNKELVLTAETDDHSLIIKIKDKGIGIEKDETDNIFEKFYRGKNAIKYSLKGTGLGLALVKYTVEAHKGNISVGSEPGWSTVFTINIPIN